MTREERKKQREAIVEYRKAGHYVRECCERFGVKESYVYMACRGINYPWLKDTDTMRQAALEQGKRRKPSVENAIRIINERAPQFEFVGNYTGVDGYVDLKCRKCGAIARKSFVGVRHGIICCDECERQKKKQREIKKERDKKQLKESKRLDKIFRGNAEQECFKQCKVCGSLFYGNRKYCSDYCFKQNKWQMKEGYRSLFPLETVYEKDNGICYLCGNVCDWNDYTIQNGIVIYGNKYPSRDHVVPKSKGGSNTWENIRLAHRICNSMKRDIPLFKKMT